MLRMWNHRVVVVLDQKVEVEYWKMRSEKF